MPDEPRYDLALPEDGDLAEAAGGVVDGLPPLGEIVDDEPAPRPVIIQVFQPVVVVVQHPRTRTAARHAGYVPAGVVVAWRRWRRRRTLAEDMAQQANMLGDRAAAIQMLQQAELERKGRHERRVAAAEVFIALVKASPAIFGAVFFLMFLLGVLLAMAKGSVSWVAWPFTAAAHVTADLVEAALVAVWAAAFGVPLALFTALYLLGRRGGGLAPNWARTAGDDDADHEVTEVLLTNALKNLRFPQVTDYLKLGMPLQFITSCRQEGRGTFAAIRLPGVPADKVIRRRADFAAGVHRAVKEVWLKTGAESAILETWIADKGALEEGAGPYPLLGEGFTDVFKGLPFGRTLKGDPIKIPVIGRNTICGGAPDQGKSNAARVTACGYTLDITTEVRIFVPDANFDFEPFRPRCSRYLMGAEDEVIEGILEELEDLKDEVQRRGQLLIDCEQQEVTAPVAAAVPGLHPMFWLLEEAHVAIQHRKYGKEIGRLLGENVKLCRKRAVHIKVSTQAPIRGSMPPDVTRNCTNGIAFAVGDHYANDALLGDGAYRSGHRATELIPGTDRGIALCKGFSGERSEIVQVHRVQVSQGSDEVTPIVRRSLKAMAGHGLAVPGTGRQLETASRDLLDDIGEVIGPDRIRLADLPARLRKLAPSYGPYRNLTGAGLRDLLDELDVRTTNPKNVPTLDPADLRKALAERGELAVPCVRAAARSPPGRAA